MTGYSSDRSHYISDDHIHSASSLTVQQLVNEHKVVLDVFLVDLAKVGRHDVTHLVKELKHHGGVDVLLGDSCQPDVGALDMEEAGAGNVCHWGSDLLAGVDHVHTERVYGVSSRARGEGKMEKEKEAFMFGVKVFQALYNRLLLKVSTL